MTAITGRPNSGKSYLLREFRKESEKAECLVGYIESNATGMDMLLYCVADLYDQWLSDASLPSQAQLLYDRHKQNFASELGETVGEVLLEIAKDAKLPGAGAARIMFEAALKLNKNLKTGGLTLPKLSYEQTFELLEILYKITGKRIILVFDAWEQSPNVEIEGVFFKRFLTEFRNWPPMHVFVAARDHDPKREDFTWPERLDTLSERSTKWEIPPLALADKSTQRLNLLSYLHETIPVTKQCENAEVLGLIDGYPGVLRFWYDGKPETLDDLRRIATNAQKLRYEALVNNRLPGLIEKGLATPHFNLACRLALLPEQTRMEFWNALQPVAFRELHGGDALRRKLVSLGVLQTLPDQPDLPSFGHRTRYEAVCKWFLENESAKPHAREEAKQLIRRLAVRIDSIELSRLPFVEALVWASRLIIPLQLDDMARALCYSAKMITQPQCYDGEIADILENIICKVVAADTQGAAVLLAKGLFNALNDAKNENNLLRRDSTPPRVARASQCFS